MQTFDCVIFTGLATAAKLLGCTANQLVTAMSTRKIRAGNDSIVKKLTLTQVCSLLKNYLHGSIDLIF
jgi:myosin heavy subunit